MEGLEAVELKFSDLEFGIRIDAELYKKSLLNFGKAISKSGYTTLGIEADLIKKGIFNIKAECYTTNGIPFVRVSNLKNMMIDTGEIIFIPESENNKNLSTYLKRNDIILSKTAYAAASLVNIEHCNTSQDTIAIKLKKDSALISHYLVVFLNTKYGLEQMQKRFTGNIQMHLNLEDCKENILIPKFSFAFQQNVKKFFENAINNQKLSYLLYSQAEELLLSELGLKDWTPKDENHNEKRFSESFRQSGRLDAEYYQTKYDELFNKVNFHAKYLKYISDIQTFNARGLQPNYIVGGTLDVINSRHILEKGLDYDNFEKTGPEYWDIQERARVFKDDILIYTTGANIGRTNVYLRDDKALASNHVNILRIKSENPIYVAFVMNSIIGKLQTEKISAGSAQQELYPKDIDQFYIPFIDKKIQQKVIENVIQSFALQTKSRQLLGLARRAVEMAIERDEEAAEWLGRETEKVI